MNIPDEVLAEADMLNGDSTLGAYEVIAVWARKQALRDAADIADAEVDIWATKNTHPRIASKSIAIAVRDLAEGDTE